MSNLPHNGGRFSQTILLVKHVYKTEGEDGYHVNAERAQEHEEIAVVPSTNAIVDPWAMVVKCL